MTRQLVMRSKYFSSFPASISTRSATASEGSIFLNVVWMGVFIREGGEKPARHWAGMCSCSGTRAAWQVALAFLSALNRSDERMPGSPCLAQESPPVAALSPGLTGLESAEQSIDGP